MNTLLTMSLTGAVMILVIVLLRWIFQNCLHRTVILLLWLVAALRLAVPVFTPSAVSVYNLVPEERVSAMRNEAIEMQPVMTQSIPDMLPAEAVMVFPSEGEQVIVEADEPVSAQELLTAVWTVGCLFCLGYFTALHIRARRRYRFAIPEEAPSYLGKIRLRRLDDLSAPLVYGFFRPVILLPVNFPKKDSPEYEHVLHHEMTHVRNGDLWSKLGMLLLTCVHWFNPCVWLMLHLVSQDLEMRCDAQVIRKLGKKKGYAITLVQAEIGRSTHFAEAAFAFSFTELRLKAITKAKVYLPRSIIFCAVLSTVLLLCFATEPKDRESGGQKETPSSSVGVLRPLREPEREIYAETVLPTERPSPTLVVDEAAQLEYLLSMDYEEYGSTMELSMKEGDKRTVTLKLPEYAKFLLASDGKEILSMGGEYRADEERYDLTLHAFDEGETEVYVFIADKQWMRIKVSVAFDLYYSVPDAWKFEEYNSSRTIYMTEDGIRTFQMKLPARAYYSYVTHDSFQFKDRDLTVSHWYDDEQEMLFVRVEARNYGWIFFTFYVDGIQWCKLTIGVGRRSAGNYSTGYSYNNGTSSTYDYLSQMGPQPVMPGNSGNAGSNNGPIIVWTPIITDNGTVIQPGTDWP